MLLRNKDNKSNNSNLNGLLNLSNRIISLKRNTQEQKSTLTGISRLNLLFILKILMLKIEGRCKMKQKLRKDYLNFHHCLVRSLKRKINKQSAQDLTITIL